jgi:23S rRNA maturation mini-RNase III
MNKFISTYRRRNQLLSLGVFFGIVFVYWLAIAPTINLIKENRRLGEQSQTLLNASKSINDYNNQITLINEFMGSYQVSFNKSQKHTLSFISEFCEDNDLSLASTGKTEISDKESYFIETNTYTVQGGFHQILKLIYKLEHIDRISQVVSCAFEKQKDIRSGKTFLTATIHLQNISLGS